MWFRSRRERKVPYEERERHAHDLCDQYLRACRFVDGLSFLTDEAKVLIKAEWLNDVLTILRNLPL